MHLHEQLQKDSLKSKKKFDKAKLKKMSTLFTARKRREKIIQLAIKAPSERENRERLYKWINTGLEVVLTNHMTISYSREIKIFQRGS